MLRQIVSPAIRTLVQKPATVAPVQKALLSSSAHPPFTGPTMDDLPVPSGSWEAQHKANQTKYNMHLAAGIVVFSATLLIAKSSGLLYLNSSPPAMPADN